MSLTHVDLSATIGALEIGSLISVFLFGIVTFQAHVYYTSFRGDRLSFKVLVAVVWILEVVHTAGINYEVYNSTITLYGEPQRLTRFPMLGVAVAMGGVITLSTQGFFAFRLYTVLPKPYSYIGIICIILSVVRCAASVYLAAQAVITESITKFITQRKSFISTLFVSGAAVDVIIAASMLFYLSNTRKKATKAMRLINFLIVYTIRTGLLTSVTAVIMLICFQTMPSNFIWLAIYAFLGKFYTNSLYSTLNSRKEMRLSIRKPTYPRQVAPISIEIKTTTEETRNDGHISLNRLADSPLTRK